jgi:hypothetical protein
VFNWKFSNLKELDKEIRNQASNQQNMMTLIIMNQGNQQEIKKKSFIFFIWWSIPPIMLKKNSFIFLFVGQDHQSCHKLDRNLFFLKKNEISCFFIKKKNRFTG